MVRPGVIFINCLSDKISRRRNTYVSSIACNKIKTDFCVDDYLSGAATISDAILLRDQLINVLKHAGFELRKLTSNEPEILSNISNTDNVHIYSIMNTVA